jgi:hypothetical protein
MAMQNANRIAGKRSRFCVLLLKTGGCWKMDRRRVRTAMRLNHCLRRVSPCHGSLQFFTEKKKMGKRCTLRRGDEAEKERRTGITHITTRLIKKIELALFSRALK